MALGLVACLTLAACGSNLDPDEVAAAGGSGAVVAGGDPAPGGTVVDPGPGTPLDPGAASDPGSAAAPPPADTGGGSGPGAPAPGDPVATQQGGSSDTDGPRDTDDPAPAPDDAVSCEGFSNGPGITADSVTIGNASDISGPVPGLFAQAQAAVVAYVDYFNSTGQTICGRSLRLERYDSRTDAAADQQAYAAGCEETFAMVGSMSAFDSGGADAAQECGLPDVRAIATTSARSACTTCYAAQPAGPDAFQNAVADFIKRNASGGQRAAMLYINAGAAAESGNSQVRLMTERGVDFVYVSPVDTAEFNYAPFVQAMKDEGVTSVQFIAAEPQFARLVQTMDQQNFEPELLLLDPTAYSPKYTDQAGSAAVGTTVFTNFTPFEEAASNRELSLYLSYLEKTSPGSDPGFFGVFAWSAAKLFVQQATALGGDLSRATLLASLRRVDDWTADGMHAPMPVGAKDITDCWRFVRWTGSTWESVEGAKYQCRGVTT